MAQKSSVRVKVVDGRKRAVAGALVAVESGSAPFPEMAFKTDAAGFVSLFLPEGTFRIGVNSGPARGAGDIAVKAGKGGELTIALK
jgi:hypothetical protein